MTCFKRCRRCDSFLPARYGGAHPTLSGKVSGKSLVTPCKQGVQLRKWQFLAARS